MSEMVNMVNGFLSKSSKFGVVGIIILFKFRWVIIIWSSTFSNGNGNIEELEFKIKGKKLMFR